MAQLPCNGLYKPRINLPFGDCAMYFDHGVYEYTCWCTVNFAVNHSLHLYKIMDRSYTHSLTQYGDNGKLDRCILSKHHRKEFPETKLFNDFWSSRNRSITFFGPKDVLFSKTNLSTFCSNPAHPQSEIPKRCYFPNKTMDFKISFLDSSASFFWFRQSLQFVTHLHGNDDPYQGTKQLLTQQRMTTPAGHVAWKIERQQTTNNVSSQCQDLWIECFL